MGSICIIGDLINNAYGRARRAWEARDVAQYQSLALRQLEQGSTYLDVNIDATQNVTVRPAEMHAFLPELITGLQAVTNAPLCFDNPSFRFHEIALEHYDRSRGGRPIINSIAASRENLEGMLELVRHYDTMVVVMVTEQFSARGSSQCMRPEECHATARLFVEMLHDKAGRTNEQIIIDPGLAPVGADTYGLINMGLDTMRLVSQDPDLAGVNMSVGLSNFAWGTPKHLRHRLERAYLTIGGERGLNFAIANPDNNPIPLERTDPIVEQLERALEIGRAREGESQEDAGFRQAEFVMELCIPSEES